MFPVYFGLKCSFKLFSISRAITFLLSCVPHITFTEYVNWEIKDFTTRTASFYSLLSFTKKTLKLCTFHDHIWWQLCEMEMWTVMRLLITIMFLMGFVCTVCVGVTIFILISYHFKTRHSDKTSWTLQFCPRYGGRIIGYGYSLNYE